MVFGGERGIKMKILGFLAVSVLRFSTYQIAIKKAHRHFSWPDIWEPIFNAMDTWYSEAQ